MAAALGLSFEDVMAATATLTKQGVPTSEAMTQIRSSMVALTKPTADMEVLLKKMGFESGQAALQTLGYAGTMAALREAADNNNSVLATALGRVEGLNALLGVTGANSEMAAADLDAMANSTGAANAAFEEMDKSTSRSMEKLKASFKDIAISVGNVLLPVLTDLVEKIKPVIENIKAWMEEHPELTKIIIIATGAIGGLLLVLGPLLMMLPGLVVLGPMVGAAFTMMLGPVGLIIAGIAALIAIGVLVWKNWDTIKEKAVEIWNNIVNFFKDIWESITDIFSKHWDKILAILFPAVGIPILIARNWEAVKDALLTPVRAAAQGIEDAINWIIRSLNKLRFEVPDWLPGIGGKEFGLNIPEISIPSFKGWEGRIPGEEGQSYLAEVHGGEYISQSPAGAGDTVITGNTFYIREEADIRKIARELHRLQLLRGASG